MSRVLEQVVSSGVVEQLQSLVREDVLRRLSNMALAGFDPAELQVRHLLLRLMHLRSGLAV